jgi:hypothetical protein
MRPVNPAIAARTLIGMTMGFSILFELGDDPAIEEASSEELAAAVSDIFLNGLRGEAFNRHRQPPVVSGQKDGGAP